MSEFTSAFSFLTLSFLVAYLIWKNDWLFGRLTESQKETAQAKVEAAQRESDYREEVARHEAEMESVLKVRELEKAMLAAERKQLMGEMERAKEHTLALSAARESRENNPGSVVGGFIRSLFG